MSEAPSLLWVSIALALWFVGVIYMIVRETRHLHQTEPPHQLRGYEAAERREKP